MKKLFILSAIILGGFNAQSQITREVKFENYVSETNCDLANNFDNPHGHEQLPDNGVGNSGCIRTRFDISTPLLLKKFNPGALSISISFQYYEVGQGLYPAGVFFNVWDKSGYLLNTVQLVVNTDLGFYPFLRLTSESEKPNGKHFSVDAPECSTRLVNANWYKIVLTVEPVAGQDNLKTSMYLYDLGLGGTTSNTLLSKQENDILGCENLTIAGSFQPGFVSDDGSYYLDNFMASGTPHTGIEKLASTNNIVMPTIVSTELPVKVDLSGDTKYSIYSITGAVVKEGVFQNNTTVNVAELPAANYVIKLMNGQNMLAKTFVKQ